MRDHGGDGEPRAAIGDGAADVPGDGAGEGGDAACWLHLVCPECGELGGHLPGCRVAETAGGQGPAGDPR
ncbi:MAG: hypothetical protein ABSC16_04810 [Candidatus Dormibacteria bacterium]|jgi:hypothetical protein